MLFGITMRPQHRFLPPLVHMCTSHLTHAFPPPPGIMVRLMLVAAPAFVLLSSIAISQTLQVGVRTAMHAMHRTVPTCPRGAGLGPPWSVHVLHAMPARAAPPVRACAHAETAFHSGTANPCFVPAVRPVTVSSIDKLDPVRRHSHRSNPQFRKPTTLDVPGVGMKGPCVSQLSPATPVPCPPTSSLPWRLSYNVVHLPQGVSKDLRTDDGADGAAKAAAEEASASKKKAAAK